MQRERQRLFRKNESEEQTNDRLSKAREYKRTQQMQETPEAKLARQQADSDYQWQRRQDHGKILANYGARFEKATQEMRRAFAPPSKVTIEYINETEEKIIEKYWDRREADTERRRSQKAAMSKEELQKHLEKNAKWHRDRRTTETDEEKASRLKIRKSNYYKNVDKYQEHMNR